MSSLCAVQGGQSPPIPKRLFRSSVNFMRNLARPGTSTTSGCPQRCPLVNPAPASLLAPVSTLPPRYWCKTQPGGGSLRPLHHRRRNHFAGKPDSEEGGAGGSRGSGSGWKSPGRQGHPAPPARLPVDTIGAPHAVRYSDPATGAPRPPFPPLPGVTPPPPSPGQGCRRSWTTVTLVRVTSRFDMAS